MTIEQLLNKLIEKGWKPRNCNYQKYEDGCLIYEKMGNNGVYSIGQYPVSLREITSKNSGLWQFVCENGMIKIEYGKIREKYDETAPTTDKNKVITYRQLLGEDNYEYRLIEASLRDESELEDFLLQNIKVEGNEK